MNNTRNVASLLVVVAAAASAAQAKPPTLARLFPPGAQRGRTSAVTASGSFDHWPVQGWADDPGIEVKAEREKGKLSIDVSAEVVPGVHWIRLGDDEGATALKPFVVGTLPELVEVEGDSPMPIARAR